MQQITVTLSSDLVQSAMRATGKRSAQAAVAELVRAGIGNTPNAKTARALRSTAKGKIFNDAQAAISHLKRVYEKA